MERIAAWWDQAELWVAGLPFAAQLPVVLLVLVPLAFGLAWMLDGALGVISRILASREPAPLRVRVRHPGDGE